jgi:hypothetical protein
MQDVKSEYAQKISSILEWADSDAPESFDDTFVLNMAEALETYGTLTVKQRAAIDNIIEKFEIDIDA